MPHFDFAHLPGARRFAGTGDHDAVRQPPARASFTRGPQTARARPVFSQLPNFVWERFFLFLFAHAPWIWIYELTVPNAVILAATTAVTL